MRKGIYILVASVLVLTLLIACGQPAPSPAPTTPATTPKTAAPAAPQASPTPVTAPAVTPQYGGIIKIVFGTMPRSFLPPLHPGGTMVFPGASHDSLLLLDEQGDYKPWLATDWKFSADFKSLTLTLRKGVKFHDGTDFNAAAVKWNIETRRDSKQGDYENVTSVTVIDDYTVRLDLDKFSNTMLVTLADLGGAIASPTTVQKLGVEKAHWFPVGTGPFKFVNYVSNQLYKLERFDGYWQKGKPYLDGFEVYLIEDKVTSALSLQKGQVDAFTQPDAQIAYDLKSKGFQVVPPQPSTVYTFVGDSANADSPFANKKVREAVEYAIDREAIVKAVGYGFYETSYQISPAYSYAHVPELQGRRAYDLAKAKQLLTEAGFPNGFKTKIYIRSTTARDPFVAAITNLKEVGIDATLEPMPIASYTQLANAGWRNAMLQQIFWVDPDWVWRRSGDVSTTSIVNKSMLRPAGLQELLEQLIKTPDFQSKKSLSQQLTKKLSDEAIVTPLWAFGFPIMYDKKIGNPAGLRNRPTTSGNPASLWLRK
ncbi:MAG: hypothetical protein HY667_02805 [Chloroflexi bacterium]|nr:hypothetical protein [Chloroflexota bacterium]